MTDTATPFPAPDAAPALEQVAPDDLRPMIDAQLKMLGELAELGLRAARAIVSRAEAETPPPAAETALAYARVSRAVRLTIMLQGKLIEAREPEEQEEKAEAPRQTFTEADYRKARVERIIERVAEAEAEDEEAADAIVCEAGERLDDEDLYGDLMDHPMSEIVARLCKDLDLSPDWSKLSQELWARREAAEAESLVARPLPLAGEGDREAVERARGSDAACPLSHFVTTPPPAGEPAPVLSDSS